MSNSNNMALSNHIWTVLHYPIQKFDGETRSNSIQEHMCDDWTGHQKIDVLSTIYTKKFEPNKITCLTNETIH